ncbi:hypothetical protein TYRP_023730 [Tyrophagus putrescentiae]|nr:hypothetical protein TYRP_023730 [Tyrophagus putrescentiae]
MKVLRTAQLVTEWAYWRKVDLLISTAKKGSAEMSSSMREFSLSRSNQKFLWNPEVGADVVEEEVREGRLRGSIGGLLLGDVHVDYEVEDVDEEEGNFGAVPDDVDHGRPVDDYDRCFPQWIGGQDDVEEVEVEAKDAQQAKENQKSGDD